MKLIQCLKCGQSFKPTRDTCPFCEEDVSASRDLPRQLLNASGNREAAQQAARTLAGMGTPGAVAVLAGALSDEQRYAADQSQFVAEQLVSVGEPAMPAITSLLADSGARPYVVSAVLDTRPEMAAQLGLTEADCSTAGQPVSSPTTTSASTTSTTSPWNIFGGILLAVGIVVLIYFVAVFDTTVSVSDVSSQLGLDTSSYNLGIGRVNNIGLMNDQRNGIIVAVLILVCGVALIVVGAMQKVPTAAPVAVTATPVTVAARSDERKCPYCAETIKAEAIICRFCNREVPPPGGPGVAVHA